MIVADDARYLPCSVFKAPEMNELSLSNDITILGADVMEAMNSDLYGPVALNRVYLQRTGYELALNLAAEIIFDAVDDCLASVLWIVLIVIKLQVLCKLAFHRWDIARIYSVEQQAILRRDCLEQRWAGFCC